MISKYRYIILGTILLCGFLVRLYRFDSPIADWHSWRQADTSAVSRNFVKSGFDILHPKFDDLSNVPSGKENPKGYRFVEFPIYNVFQAGFYKIFKTLTVEEWGRIVTIISSLLSSVFIYLITKKHLNEKAAIFAMFFYLFLPYNVYYGRSILPDPTMVMAILGGTYFFDKWLSSNVILRPKAEESQMKTRSFAPLRMKIFFILALIFTASAFLLKPYALFFTLPMIYLAIKRLGFRILIKWQLWIFAVLTLAPLIFWRLWIQQYPEGIPQSAWLFNEGNIRFRPAFFRWIFFERITKLILGFFGLPLLAFGILSITKKQFKDKGFFISFAISSLLYLFVIARGNVQHDYYQILIMPSIAIFLGIGAEFVLSHVKENFSKITSHVFLFIFSFFSILFAWYFIRDFFNINNYPIVIAGTAVDKYTPKNAKIIALYNGDTSFLYQTKRQGWASFEKSLPEMIKMGANYLVLVSPSKQDINGFGKEYQIVSLEKDYMILNLSKKL